MPADRTYTFVRRSQRLSKQVPEDIHTWAEASSLYPSPEPRDLPSSSANNTHYSTPSSAYWPSPETRAHSPTDSYLPSPPDSPTSPSASYQVATARSSHARKRGPDYVARPVNAFLLFRSWICTQQKIKSTVEKDHCKISQIAGLAWKDLTPAQQAPWKEEAAERARLHKAQHPDYKYSPIARKAKGTKRSVKRESTSDDEKCQRIATLLRQGYEGEELERCMKQEEEQEDEVAPRSRSKPSSRTKPSRPRRAKPAPVVTKLESPEPEMPAEHVETYDAPSLPSGYVPTSEIPHLDLSAPEPLPKREYVSPPPEQTAELAHHSSTFIHPYFGGAEEIEIMPTEWTVDPHYSNYNEFDSSACDAYVEFSAYMVVDGEPSTAMNSPFMFDNPNPFLSPQSDQDHSSYVSQLISPLESEPQSYTYESIDDSLVSSTSHTLGDALTPLHHDYLSPTHFQQAGDWFN